MNVPAVIKELEEKYPGHTIIKNDESMPTEIICETEPGTEHPEYSIAIAVIDKSIRHYHTVATETYKVLRGTLRVYINDEDDIVVQEGETLVIHPGQLHWATGDETWIECESRPAWTREDHILAA